MTTLKFDLQVQVRSPRFNQLARLRLTQILAQQHMHEMFPGAEFPSVQSPIIEAYIAR